VRRRHCVSVPVNFGQRREGAPPVQKIGVGGAALADKSFFQRFPKKFRSILKVFR